MCGIAGIFGYREQAPPVDSEELLKIREAMRRRGPDGEGLWLSPDRRAGLAHRRLSIIDLSDTGAQPMASADGGLVIVFNGEIYNYRELRRELEAQGATFRTQSDTEVLLQLYASKGAAMVDALRGMYAFAIWNLRERTLFLARDPFGIKPLYYSDSGGTFRFASQVKALLAGGGVDTAPDSAGHVGFFLLGFVPEPYTTTRAIRALPAGTHMTVQLDRGIAATENFFSINRELKAAARPPQVPEARALRSILRDAMRESARYHMVSDVPVGVFLSSGLDSTTLAAFAAEAAGQPLRTLTLGLREYRGTIYDEVEYAEHVAADVGAQHQTQWVSRAHFEEEYDSVMQAMDQPTVDGVNTYFVAQAGARLGLKVALSGLGGDELFGTYPSFTDVPRMVRLLSFAKHLPSAGRLLRRATAPLLQRFTSPKFAGLLEYGGTLPGAYLLRRALFMPWELDEILDPEMAREGWGELSSLEWLGRSCDGLGNGRKSVTALELDWYTRCQLLRDADWAGMAHSLEIRVPYIDIGIFRTIAPFLALPQSPKKSELAHAAPIHPREALLRRKKTGFSIPVQEWLYGRRKKSLFARGLRDWATAVDSPAVRTKRALVLVSDAFGGRGGIAKFNRDLLTALSAYPEFRSAEVFPRVMPDPPGPLPRGIHFRTTCVGSKLRYGLNVLASVMFGPRYDLVICGHINLLPLASAAAKLARRPLVLFIYGIDAWQPTGNRLTNSIVRGLETVVSISAITRDRFLSWSGIDAAKVQVLPNAIDLERFNPGPRSDMLVERYGLKDRKVLLTLGRLASAERYKGFDEVLDILPDLAIDVPEISYLIVGEGDDRARLQKKAADLGVAGRVVFTGYVPEAEKADHYRLADAYVMPSRGEGFGFVYLEAMACGIPTVGSAVDGSREALANGDLGVLVDPADRRAVLDAVRGAIDLPRRRPPQLAQFSFANFSRRLHATLRSVLEAKMGGAA